MEHESIESLTENKEVTIDKNSNAISSDEINEEEERRGCLFFGPIVTLVILGILFIFLLFMVLHS
ncbi:hypothetical protein KO500_07850 [Cellulophaga baltica]|uniref:hypothetical protein n=1 Tax=Cellulophaga TaxID=104264 RepID=UPI001C06DFC5|nr:MULTISPECIES: hypothetical protein [Cellulophaga]MBU2996343.1 hypothetical protein [Cellulophaga baltica]MDO6767739.1 hypothetical protein [Cellulophaga sp. 1_MG-2023]